MIFLWCCIFKFYYPHFISSYSPVPVAIWYPESPFPIKLDFGVNFYTNSKTKHALWLEWTIPFQSFFNSIVPKFYLLMLSSQSVHHQHSHFCDLIQEIYQVSGRKWNPIPVDLKFDQMWMMPWITTQRLSSVYGCSSFLPFQNNKII